MEDVDMLETFMLKHGENIVDTLGGEVDRIEKTLKVCDHHDCLNRASKNKYLVSHLHQHLFQV